MKEYKSNNTYVITTVIIMALLLVEQLIWINYRPSGIVAISGTLVLTMTTIFDCKKFWNAIYFVDEEKIVFTSNKNSYKTIIYWHSVITAKSFGWKYCPLAWKSFVISDGQSNIVVRMVGLKEYRELWIFAYDMITKKSKACITNNQLDRTITTIQNQTGNKTGDDDNQGTVP